jgi:hypothetical protein
VLYCMICTNRFEVIVLITVLIIACSATHELPIRASSHAVLKPLRPAPSK